MNLLEPLQYAFMRDALLVGTLIAATCAVLSCFLILKGWSLMGDAISHAVLPQVLPQLADITIYRWEYHFRASTVLGIVGAGGIGFELIAALRIIRYDQVSAILLTILMCVIVVDWLGAWLRKQLK